MKFNKTTILSEKDGRLKAISKKDQIDLARKIYFEEVRVLEMVGASECKSLNG
jgi:hypothetical protein